ncbi:alpha/beta fold hydrolase [Streptomonospora nanhaiensis]|uniref:Pimeloyl-ACP methyl ester carboxylesterase n=1 Tax=Streptomonospora nanhaiensis TaxID=1323731 RepID=A0A853BVI1_9ACTN|nr:alpha/beta hydrolase [Streptomonospora nanhaiensis]MBV2364557.1 lysophospholipase [Streptomonospora nanhaiensis]NYI99093.1 pimeloyl-ACP methyl ester carboxylesterase [Streptomonospora nanhaiensis]
MTSATGGGAADGSGDAEGPQTSASPEIPARPESPETPERADHTDRTGRAHQTDHARHAARADRAGRREPPAFPHRRLVGYHDGLFGRVCSHTVGTPRPGVPEAVLVQGLGVSQYLLPALAALGAWTRAHLIELPGFGGSGDPPRELGVAEHGRCVAEWIFARHDAPVVLMGHSSGTQVAAHAARGHPLVAGAVLASPTIDPAARRWGPLVARWLLDGRLEAPGLNATQRPEWVRAGPRRLLHTVSTHLADHLEESVARLEVPVLVLYGRRDRIATERWARSLAATASEGAFARLPGAHAFPWSHPEAWSAPVRAFALRAGGAAAGE